MYLITGISIKYSSKHANDCRDKLQWIILPFPDKDFFCSINKTPSFILNYACIEGIALLQCVLTFTQDCHDSEKEM